MTLSTLLPLPQPCEVCGGSRRRVSLAGVDDHPRHWVAIVPCLACVWGIPVVHLPMRGDR